MLPEPLLSPLLSLACLLRLEEVAQSCVFDLGALKSKNNQVKSIVLIDEEGF
jgi:hypothetical protein